MATAEHKDWSWLVSHTNSTQDCYELQTKMLLDTSFDPLVKNDKHTATTDYVFAKYQQQLEMNNRKTIQEYVRLYDERHQVGFGHLPIDAIKR